MLKIVCNCLFSIVLAPFLINDSFAEDRINKLRINKLKINKLKLYPRAKVSFNDFKSLVANVEAHRAKRLIDLDAFLKMSKESEVVILDTRSKFRFDRIHVKGAKHLNFSDFTQSNLKKVIPNFNTKVLIYCNNNFDGNQVDFASKVVASMVTDDGSTNEKSTKSNNPLEGQFLAQERPRMMALNVPTYINLFGYGYRNVYELNELVNVEDPRITFEGTIVKRKTKSATTQTKLK